MPRIDVYSDLNPRELNKIGLAIFAVWSEFATGQRALGGRRLKQPTGKYASSLQIERDGKNHIAVFADESIAPHAGIIEKGHGPYSMLDYLEPGGRYRITGRRFVEGSGSARFAMLGERRVTRRGSGLVRAGRFVPSVTGIVRTPTNMSKLEGRSNSSRTGPAWTVPAMPAYSPSRIIAALFRRRVADMGGTINFSR